MENSPFYIKVIFGIITILAIFIFYKASGKSRKILLILLVWLLLQTVISSTGFYSITRTIPPRFLLAVIPPLLLIICLFITERGKRFIDTLDIKLLTILHVIRIPIEIVLLLLFLDKTVPQLMTFEGRNFDILSGLTAPVIYYLVFIKKKLSRKALLVWNFFCLGLLVNIVVIAILSAPFTFQRLAFDQPNIAVLYFPFIWLPSCVVPLVLFSHLASIRQLLSGNTGLLYR